MSDKVHSLLQRQIQRLLDSQKHYPDLTALFHEISDTYRDYEREIEESRKAFQANARELVQARQKAEALLEDTLGLKEQQDGDYFLAGQLLEPLSRNRSRGEQVRIDFLLKQIKQVSFRRWQIDVGGDLCNAHVIRLFGRNYTTFLCADAMGKSLQGASGALVLGAVYQSIILRARRKALNFKIYPEIWLRNTYQELHNVFSSFDSKMTVACVLGLIDERTGFTYFINCDMPPLVLYRDGACSNVDYDQCMERLGLNLEDRYFRIQTISLQPGDVLFCGSDGKDDLLIADQKGGYDLNEDPAVFQNAIVKARGDLSGVFDRIEEIGQLTDDLGLMRLEYTGLRQLQRSEQNAEQFVKLVREAKTIARALQEEDWSMAADLARTIQIPRDGPAEFYKIMIANFERLDDQDALLELLQIYLNEYQQDDEFIKQASDTCLVAGVQDEALNQAERYVLRHPGEVEFLKVFLKLCLQNGRQGKAHDVAMQLIRQEPDQMIAREIMQQLRESEEAEDRVGEEST